ncbi:MAG: glycosyltransferase family 1 protein [Chloroflexi bacterium]|nr:glycosyltransferase family 1 protein [Chloroflexota bacterium]
MTLRAAMLSVHTSPLATLGGKKAGGMNVYVRELSSHLAELGVQVDVFTRREGEGPAIIQTHDNVRVIAVDAGPRKRLSTAAIYDHLPAFAHNLLNAFPPYDIIHSHYWLSGWVAERLREAWGSPYLQMFHTLGHMKNRIATASDQQESGLRIDVETQIIGSADRLIAATPAERIQLMWLYNAAIERITISSPGVDLTRFYPRDQQEARQRIGVDPHRHLIVFVGRLEPLKGLDTLFRAAALLRNSGSEAFNVAVIGGEAGGPEFERLVGLRRELGLETTVQFLGTRTQDVLPDYYSAADAVVMPSHYESFGMVALEAMACGTPVVASEVGGLAYLVEDGVTGLHVPYREPGELAARLGLLLANSSLREEMGRSAAQHAQQYDWRLIASQMEALYQAVVRGDC